MLQNYGMVINRMLCPGQTKQMPVSWSGVGWKHAVCEFYKILDLDNAHKCLRVGKIDPGWFLPLMALPSPGSVYSPATGLSEVAGIITPHNGTVRNN